MTVRVVTLDRTRLIGRQYPIICTGICTRLTLEPISQMAKWDEKATELHECGAIIANVALLGQPCIQGITVIRGVTDQSKGIAFRDCGIGGLLDEGDFMR